MKITTRYHMALTRGAVTALSAVSIFRSRHTFTWPQPVGIGDNFCQDYLQYPITLVGILPEENTHRLDLARFQCQFSREGTGDDTFPRSQDTPCSFSFVTVAPAERPAFAVARMYQAVEPLSNQQERQIMAD